MALARWLHDQGPRPGECGRSPIGFVVTPGEAHEAPACSALMNKAEPEPKVLIADAIHADMEGPR